MVDWAAGQVGLHFIPPGEPWRNGYVESFNSRIRDECLNINSFWSLAQARVVISDWKHDYNHYRRHSALGYEPRPATRKPVPTDQHVLPTVDRYTGPVTDLLGASRFERLCNIDGRRRLASKARWSRRP